MVRALKFLGLVVVLNIVRYTLCAPFEQLLIFDGLFSAMEASDTYFNNEYTGFDWATSFFYNFVMWFTCALVFALLYPQLQGAMWLRSLKTFGLMWLFFASVSAIYMNHYSHPKDFYIWTIVDGIISFGIVGLANGFLYPRFFREARITERTADPA